MQSAAGGWRLPGYLKTACDTVHLNPMRAYLWSSLVWYAAAREQRPGWILLDWLLGEHGIEAGTLASRGWRNCPR